MPTVDTESASNAASAAARALTLRRWRGMTLEERRRAVEPACAARRANAQRRRDDAATLQAAAD